MTAFFCCAYSYADERYNLRSTTIGRITKNSTVGRPPLLRKKRTTRVAPQKVATLVMSSTGFPWEKALQWTSFAIFLGLTAAEFAEAYNMASGCVAVCASKQGAQCSLWRLYGQCRGVDIASLGSGVLEAAVLEKGKTVSLQRIAQTMYCVLEEAGKMACTALEPISFS